VAIWVGLGVIRIEWDIPILALLIPGYLLVLVLLFFSDRDYVAIAADASGVATGPVTNTFLLTVALGAASARGTLDPIVGGFGFVALVAVAPLTSVMALGLYLRWATKAQRK